VQVLSLEDKKQITMVVSCSDVMDYFHQLCLLALHLKHFHQTIEERKFASKMAGTSPSTKTIGYPWKRPKKLSQTLSFFTCTNIIHIQILELKEQKMMWIIDYWSVHISKKILDW
jgi:hypothetical protein